MCNFTIVGIANIFHFVKHSPILYNIAIITLEYRLMYSGSRIAVYRLLRSKTKCRVFRKLKYRVAQYREGVIDEHSLSQSLQSYLGALSHAHAYQLSQDLKNQYWYWIHE